MTSTAERGATPRDGRPAVVSSKADSRENITGGAQPQFPLVIATLDKNRREQLRVAIDRYQGLDLLDLRVTVDLTEASGVQTPTKKGISIRIGQLPDLLAALQDAVARARELGMLDGGI